MRPTLVALAFAASLLAFPPPAQLEPLWAFLSSLWSEPSPKIGCGMDPNGLCAPAPQPETDAGCGMDPDGRCTPAPQVESDAGCGADPSGCS
jgi:hypothetical protein